MHEPPLFLRKPGTPPAAATLRPVPTDRRGEAIAWVCALGAGLAALALRWGFGSLPPFLPLLALAFGLAGGVISFGNWVDRRTTIHFGPQGVAFESPLRRVHFAWEEIREVWYIPGWRGGRVVVRGRDCGFQYRTLAELSLGTSRRFAFGVEGGDRLAGWIRARAGLGEPEREERAWVCRRAVDSL